MHFTVNSRRYVVSIASRPLILMGQPCQAKLDRAGARILISDQVLKKDRRRLLFHELRHIWVDAHGRPEAEEADADHSAAMMDAMLEQYLAQGGDAALEGLEPERETSVHREPSGPLSHERRCGCCDAIVAPGSIFNGEPEWNADAGSWTMDRGMECEACSSVTCWREGCTSDGLPLGSILAHPQPRILCGREAGRWKEEHRVACR